VRVCMCESTCEGTKQQNTSPASKDPDHDDGNVGQRRRGAQGHQNFPVGTAGEIKLLQQTGLAAELRIVREYGGGDVWERGWRPKNRRHALSHTRTHAHTHTQTCTQAHRGLVRRARQHRKRRRKICRKVFEGRAKAGLHACGQLRQVSE
jgi:hypothetical protein